MFPAIARAYVRVVHPTTRVWHRRRHLASMGGFQWHAILQRRLLCQHSG